MVSLADLWLPILLSAVLVFVASSLIHMVLGWHRHDFKKLPAEDAVMEALRPFNLGPGDYVAPLPQSMAQMSSPELKAKMASGPRFSLAILGAGALAEAAPLRALSRVPGINKLLPTLCGAPSSLSSGAFFD